MRIARGEFSFFCGRNSRIKEMTITWRPAAPAVGGLLLGAIILTSAETRSAPQAQWWTEKVESRLAEAGTNRVELVRALGEVPIGKRHGLAFLLENMPTYDLKLLTSTFLLEDIQLAYEAWEKAPWHQSVAEELFLNDVLPYACLNEPRDPWRAKLSG